MSGREVVLVTGASGYIGSHACVELLDAGYAVVGLDDFSNSAPVAIERVRDIAGTVDMVDGDVRDGAVVGRIMAERSVSAVLHFAGLKAVGESVEDPRRYYDVNVLGTLSVLRAMQDHDVRRFVFSSSCTVYGDPAPEAVPLTEAAPIAPVSPYGHSKSMVETILRDTCRADPAWRAISLRYFNPIGAHPSGTLGEDPQGVPNNLLPYIMQTAVGRRPEVHVFGDDYPTPDGTCIRDYIHVLDLAAAHVAALRALDQVAGFDALNVGTGRGSSVLEIIDASERAVGRPIPYRVVGRRAGDAAAVYADPARAERILGWRAERSLDEMCRDHWRWQEINPDGYRGYADSSAVPVDG